MKLKGVSLVKYYINEYCPNDVLTRSREIELFKKLEEGEDEVKDEIIRYNIRLVINLAKKYKNCGMDMDDLTQEGIIGLMKAIDKFDYKKGYKFSTYAIHWIKNYILRAVYLKTRIIKAPSWLVESLNKINKLNTEYNIESFKETARELDISEERIDRIISYLANSSSIKSLNEPIGDADGLILEDLVEDEEFLYANEHIDLEKVMEHLDEREQYIINRRFYYGDTLSEIGSLLSLTKERIRVLEKRALTKIRKKLAYG